MSEPNDFNAIPKTFWSFEKDAPFECCSLCGEDLFKPGTGLFSLPNSYHIEKAYKKDEVLYECAICSSCRENLTKELSDQSLKLISNYLGEHVDPTERYEQLIEAHSDSPDGWINHCMVKGTSVDDTKEYQICGEFVGTQLRYSVFPYALGNEAIEELTQLLSDETRGALDDFSNKVFDIDLSNPMLFL